MAQLVKNLQCGRPVLNPWVGKIPWRRERLPTVVFWPGEFHGLYNPWDHRELNTTERLSHFLKSLLEINETKWRRLNTSVLHELFVDWIEQTWIQ